MGSSRGWRYAAAAFWVANGLNHFRAPRFYKAIVPPPFERWKSEVNVASGAAEVIGGLAVLPDRTRPAARWWLLATLLAVYWANVHMALRPRQVPAHPAGALVRATTRAGPVRLAHVAGDAIARVVSGSGSGRSR